MRRKRVRWSSYLRMKNPRLLWARIYLESSRARRAKVVCLHLTPRQPRRASPNLSPSQNRLKHRGTSRCVGGWSVYYSLNLLQVNKASSVPEPSKTLDQRQPEKVSQVKAETEAKPLMPPATGGIRNETRVGARVSRYSWTNMD